MKDRVTILVKLSISKALEFSNLRTLVAFFEDSPSRDIITLYNV